MEALIWVTLILQTVFSIGNKLGFRDCGKVFLTISSLDNKLEINWVTDCNKNDTIPNVVTLHDKDVTQKGYDKPLLKVNIKANTGYHKTGIDFGDVELPKTWQYYDKRESLPNGKQCHRFWIASWFNEAVLDLDCFSINPSWMSDISDDIKDKRIGNIMIPGTHNAGSYLAKGKIYESYVMNQEVSIWQQLLHGIRYFDFRVGYYGYQKFTINHDVLPLGDLQPLLDELKTFLRISPKEVVVLDFHRFPIPPSANIKGHQKLLKIIYGRLGDFILPPDPKFKTKGGPTLQEIWDTKKNLIVCYGERDMAKDYAWAWNPLKQFWGDKRKPNELNKYLESVMNKHPTGSNPMWAAMAELTPNTLDVIFRRVTLRKYADEVNRYVTDWYRNGWYKGANIVATDFFFGNDIINIAIEGNKEKL